MDSFHASSDWVEDPTMSGTLAASGCMGHHAPSVEGPGCDQIAGGHWLGVHSRPARAGEPLGRRKREAGAVGWGFLWLIGIPIPILVILFVLRGCT